MREVHGYTRPLTVLWVGGTCCLRAVTTVVLLFSPFFQIFLVWGPHNSLPAAHHRAAISPNDAPRYHTRVGWRLSGGDCLNATVQTSTLSFSAGSQAELFGAAVNTLR